MSENNNESNLDEEKINNENLEQTEEIKEKTEVEILEEKLSQSDEKCKEYLDRLQRTMAEFDNFRKRTTVEKASMFELGNINIIEKFLPILDNFERALISTPEEEKQSNMYKGIEMILKQFTEVFNTLEIKEVDGTGEEFNPNIHNAVMHIEDENLGKNIVAEVLQKGYKYKDKIIRPSMVKVAN